MNTYRVTFYASYRNVLKQNSLANETLWVSANTEHHAVAVATILALSGTGNAAAIEVGDWIRDGLLYSVCCVLETN